MSLINLIDRLKYIGLIAFSLIVIFGYWIVEKDFMYIEDPIEIEYDDNQMLENSVGKYVKINNACTREISLFSKRDNQEKQIFAAISCYSEMIERTRLFVEVNNNNFSSIEARLEKMEFGELNLFEGRLKKLKFSNDEAYFFKNAGVIFNEADSFLLKSNKTPRLVLKVFYTLIIGLTLFVIVVFIVFYRFIDRPKKIASR